jgi:trk system potassium uptake protein TrkH
LGGALYASQRRHHTEIDHRTAFALVTLAWVISGIIGAVPYYLSGTLPHATDSIFESLSGFTGTGASVITDVEKVDRAMLLWRSVTQWLGGLGIIVFFVAVLPALGFSGVQLFKSEGASPNRDRLTPRVKETAQKLWFIYVALTALLAVLLFHGGMSAFDAVNHALTTLPTGGFSTKNSGMAFYNSFYIDMVVSLFMVLGAINFSLLYRLLIVRDFSVVRDTELRWYLSVLALSIGILFLCLWGTHYEEASEALRHAVFTVSCIGTSTGFTHQDFALWTPTPQVLLVMLMVMGGMSGSTAGGLKCIRLVAAFKQLNRQLKQVVHPKAVIPVKANDHVIPESVIDAIWGLIFAYFLTFSVAALVLSADGLDIVTATSAVFSSLSNIGPALGSLGPIANYSGLSDLSKLALSLCMLLGRLEFFAVLVLFTPTFWRR